jgi:hypothetical protein
VSARLPLIFPEGLSQRNYLVRDIAVKTVFAMIYAGAVEGTDRWIRPNQVTRMTDAQAAQLSDAARQAWVTASLRKEQGETKDHWYATDSREPIRDETLRYGLLEVGAAVQRVGLSTTSSLPRWALEAGFAALFVCPDEELVDCIEDWRASHLTPQALARTALAARGVGATHAKSAVLVTFPNGETRRMTHGLSSEITKAVVESFAKRFLLDPGVLWVSESGNKVVARDNELASRVGLDIDQQQVLPDVILVDLGQREPLFVFVEVVATDGPITDARMTALLALVRAGGHADRNAAFVTAYWDRDRGEFRRTIGTVAWGSLVWSASEPDKIIVHRDTGDSPVTITELLPFANSDAPR